MRTEFHADLDRMTGELAEMCAISADIMAAATTALVEADLGSESQIRADMDRLGRKATEVNDRAFAMLALQAPVARDLRTVVSAIQIAADANRMGGLAANVVKVARRHHPCPAVPTPAMAHFAAMGQLAAELAHDVRHALADDDVASARRLCDEDNAMDGLHRELFALVADPRWPYGAAAASDVVLIGRFYGRFADHVSEIARRVVFRSVGHTQRV